MPVHMRGRFCEDELSTAVLSPPFSFSKGIKLLRTECRPWGEEKGFAYGLGGYMYPDHITEDFCLMSEMAKTRRYVTPKYKRE